ncbi:PREDICTED: uncharacterized protein LOC104801569, partial [Tarenaya hassleriana]|uniref:uncharacterized protein LOC104801569 n=1 Tax=Tarenaya hassleriana TaxID=28532 RepID=UPI00053C7A09
MNLMEISSLCSFQFAHRDCIQRWCDEKGNTTCEICLQEYKPGYTAIPKQSRFVEAAVTIRDSLQISRRENARRRIRREISDSPECNSAAADRCVSCCRTLVLTFSVVLLVKHALDVIYGIEKYPFTVLTVLVLKAIGILLPMVVILRTIAAVQKSLRHQYPESEDDEGSNYEDEDEDEQHRHLNKEPHVCIASHFVFSISEDINNIKENTRNTINQYSGEGALHY